MVQEPELEERGTCYYGDDADIDPDVALAYIGDKVQSILGHLQKEFDGQLSAENLGAKYGGYGSFLSMHQRFPSIKLQQKSPMIHQNPPYPKSHNVCPEGRISYHVTLSIKRDATSSPFPSLLPSSQTSKISSFGTSNSIKQKVTLVSAKVSQAFLENVELHTTTSKSDNLPDHRNLKVRIKVGPESLSQYNAQICSLGLTSPSSSDGNSYNESDGLLLDSHQTPNESPSYMLKVITTSPLSNGLLLSPLCEDLLNLARERDCSVESEEAAPKKSAVPVQLLNDDVIRGNNTKFVDKNVKLVKPGDIFINDLKICDQKKLGGDNLGCSTQPLDSLNCKSFTEAVRNSDKDVPIKRRNIRMIRLKRRAVSVDLAKDASVGHSSGQSYDKHEPEPTCSSIEKINEHKERNSQKGVSLDHGNKGRCLSFKAFSDNSEGEGIKNTSDDSRKAGLSSTIGEQNEFVSHAAERPLDGSRKKLKVRQTCVKKEPKAENLRGGDCAAPESKFSRKKDTHRLQVRLEQIENPKLLSERPSSDMKKDFNLDGVKSKLEHTNKLKENSRNNICFDKSSDTHMVESLTAAFHSKEGLLSGLERTVDPHMLIKEDWVACDRCEKWRLLPYGKRSDQLPEKWVCTMLDWLPGMNSCNISEDETSAAIRAPHLIPVSENQHNFQPNANGTIAGSIFLASGDQTNQRKQNTISMNHGDPSDGKKHMHQLGMKGLKKCVKQCPPGINASNISDMHNPNKSATVSVKLKKRKSEDVIIDDANPKKKLKESCEYNIEKGEMKRVISEDAFIVDNFQTSGVIGNIVKSGHRSQSVLKNEKKKSAKKDGISEVQGNVQNHVKTHPVITQDLPYNGPLGVNTCKDREVARTKIRLKGNAYRQHQVETGPNNVGNLQDRKKIMNEERKDDELHRDKRPRRSPIENEFKRSQGDDVLSRRKSGEARVLSGSKEHPRGRTIEKELVVKQQRAKARLTIEDIDKLRKDLTCKEMSMAATSRSSKVSNSRKNRLSHMERESSPVDSVSSSPMRLCYSNQASTMMTDTAGKFQDLDESSKIVDLKNTLKRKTDVDAKLEVLSDMRHPLSHDSNLNSAKNSATVGKNNLRKSSHSRSEKQSSHREHEKNDLKLWDSMQQNVEQDLVKSSVEKSQVAPSDGKVCIELLKGGKQAALCPHIKVSRSSASLKRSHMDLKPDDASVLGDTLKAHQGTVIACLQDRTENYTSNDLEKYVVPNASAENKNVSASAALKAADNFLKEAEELKVHADLIKNSGFISESNYEYFKAALKFLHGASLLETCSGEPGQHMESRPMQMYTAAAQLCKICASGYEKSHELAAAALSHKCIEVAYMRVVYFKSSTTSRVWQDLQSILQMVPQGESPSSSASDVDSLNNLAMTHKATLSKGIGSQAGNHVMVPRNGPHFTMLLEFMKYVNSAIEATKKSHSTFAVAHVELKESKNKDTIAFVKRVIHFSFQDIDEFVRLALLAFNSINHQGVCANKK